MSRLFFPFELGMGGWVADTMTLRSQIFQRLFCQEQKHSLTDGCVMITLRKASLVTSRYPAQGSPSSSIILYLLLPGSWSSQRPHTDLVGMTLVSFFCPLLVHSDLVSDEICASLSKMTFRWEKTLAQVEKAAKLLDKDVLGTTWLLTGWVYHWSVCNARCLTVHTVCTVHWRCELKVARCELRGWTETRGAAGTTDTFILSWLMQRL